MLPETARRCVLVWSFVAPALLGILTGIFLIGTSLAWLALPLIVVFCFLNGFFRHVVDEMAVYASFEKRLIPSLPGQPMPEEWTGDLVRPAIRQFLLERRGETGNSWTLYRWIERNGPPWTHWIMRHVLGCKHFGESLRMLPRPHDGEVRTWWERDKVRRRWYICRQEIPGTSQLDPWVQAYREALKSMGYPVHMFKDGRHAELVSSPGGPIRGKTCDGVIIDDAGPMEPPLKPGEEVVMVVSLGGPGPDRNGDVTDPKALEEAIERFKEHRRSLPGGKQPDLHVPLEFLDWGPSMGRIIRVKGRKSDIEEFGAKQRNIGVRYRRDAHKDESTEFGFPPPFGPAPKGLRSVVAEDGVSVDYVQDFDPALEAKIGERLQRFVGRPGSVELRKEIVAELMAFVPPETARPMEDRVGDLMDICARACIPCDRAEAEKAIRTEDARTLETKGRMIVVGEPHKPKE